jgi:hypothetical protein
MLVATFLGVFIIPGNYTFVEGLGKRRKKTEAGAAIEAPPPHAPPVPAQAVGGHS